MKTTNYNFNLIEKSDRILNTLDDLNENFNNIDSELYEKEKELATTKQKLERTEQRLEKAEKKVDQAEAILDTSKSSGKNVYFDNAKNYPLMSLKGEGKSEQFTTTGKNLIDLTQLNANTPISMKVSACDKSNVKSNSITLTAGGTWSNLFFVFPENYFAKNEDIVVCANFLETIAGRTSPVGFVISGSNNNVDYTEIKRAYPINAEYNKSTFISLTANVETYKYIRIRIWINSTATEVTPSESVVNVSEVMIARGTDDTYEPYTGGPSPNPEYPQEIKIISEASYRGCGKNLYDFKNVEFVNSPYSSSEITENGFKIVSKQDGTYRYTRHLLKNFKKYLGKTLYFSCNLKASSKNTPLIIFTWSNSSNPNFKTIATFRATDTVIEVPFPESIPSGAENISILFYSNGSGEGVIGDYVEYSNIILANENITDYEPYQESTLPIDLQGNELASVGTISDKLLIDRKGNVAIEKNVGKRIFTGAEEENWVFNSATLNIFEMVLKSVPLYKNDSVSRIISNTFLGVMWKDSWTKNNSITIGGGNNILVRTDKYNTIEDFKAFLSEQNLIIYYVLKNPQLISLGTISNPEIFKGVNNIVVETNLGNMQIEVEYVEDLQKRIEKIEQAIISLGGI